MLRSSLLNSLLSCCIYILWWILNSQNIFASARLCFVCVSCHLFSCCCVSVWCVTFELILLLRFRFVAFNLNSLLVFTPPHSPSCSFTTTMRVRLCASVRVCVCMRVTLWRPINKGPLVTPHAYLLDCNQFVATKWATGGQRVIRWPLLLAPLGSDSILIPIPMPIPIPIPIPIPATLITWVLANRFLYLLLRWKVLIRLVRGEVSEELKDGRTEGWRGMTDWPPSNFNYNFHLIWIDFLLGPRPDRVREWAVGMKVTARNWQLTEVLCPTSLQVILKIIFDWKYLLGISILIFRVLLKLNKFL